MASHALTPRQKSLKLLCDQWGGPTGLAKKLGYSGPSYISHMIGGHRPITEKTIAHIEAKLDLPRGWMDRDHTEATIGHGAKVNTMLFAQAVAVAGTIAQELGARLSVEKFEGIVGLVYECALGTGKVSDDFARRLIRLVM